MSSDVVQTPETSHDGAPASAWTKGLAPRYIALFLLVVYYDQLAPHTLAVAGLVPAALAALVAGVVCNLVFFRPVALAGLRQRKTIEQLGADAFGRIGGLVFVNIVLAACQVVWFAVALHYAIDVSLRSLASLRLLDVRHLEPTHWNGLMVPGALFLWVAVVWAISSAVIGTVAFRLVAAVMAGYQTFPALVLACLVAWALPASRYFVPSDTGWVPIGFAGTPAFWGALVMVQLVCGFFASHAALSADWGRASPTRRDVVLGGWAGITMAAAAIAALALLAVAGARGRAMSVIDFNAPRIVYAPAAYTITHVLLYDIGGPAGALGLITLGLGLLGPACFTPFLFERLMRPLAPRLPRWALPLIAAVLALPLLVSRLPTRLDLVFSLLGAVAAPLVAVVASRNLRFRRLSEPPRTPTALNPAAAVAWLFGAVVGLVPVVGPLCGIANSQSFQPAVLYSYLAAFIAYQAAASLGMERGRAGV